MGKNSTCSRSGQSAPAQLLQAPAKPKGCFLPFWLLQALGNPLQARIVAWLIGWYDTRENARCYALRKLRLRDQYGDEGEALPIHRSLGVAHALDDPLYRDTLRPAYAGRDRQGDARWLRIEDADALPATRFFDKDGWRIVKTRLRDLARRLRIDKHTLADNLVLLEQAGWLHCAKTLDDKPWNPRLRPRRCKLIALENPGFLPPRGESQPRLKRMRLRPGSVRLARAVQAYLQTCRSISAYTRQELLQYVAYEIKERFTTEPQDRTQFRNGRKRRVYEPGARRYKIVEQKSRPVILDWANSRTATIGMNRRPRREEEHLLLPVVPGVYLRDSDVERCGGKSGPAILLAQLRYDLKHERQTVRCLGSRWVKRSAAKWGELLGAPRRSISRWIVELRDMGLVASPEQTLRNTRCVQLLRTANPLGGNGADRVQVGGNGHI